MSYQTVQRNHGQNTHGSLQLKQLSTVNDRLQSVVPLYPGLKWLTCAKTTNRTLHPLIMSAGNLQEVPRIAVHLKIVTGTYILQSNRASFNQNEVDPTCLLCKTRAETLSHFLLHCAILESIRESIL